MNWIGNIVSKSKQMVFNLKGKYILISFRMIILFLIVFFVLYGEGSLLKNREIINPIVVRWILLLSAFQLLSNIALIFIQKKAVTIGLFLYDIALISSAIYWSQGSNNDLFLIYFLVIFSTVIFRKPSMSFVVGGIAGLIYGFLFFAAHNFGDLLHPLIMIRFPLLMIVAFFCSIIAQDVEVEMSTLKKVSGNLEAQVRERTAALVAEIEERKLIQEQLYQSQKMEAVGRLAGGIAHDFNNLLTVIMGYCDVILTSNDKPNPFKDDLEEIKKSVGHAAALTGQLLAFSRKQMFSPKILNLNSIIRNSEKMLGRLIREDIKLVTHLDSGLEQIEADPSQIEQVIVNLAVNACDSMPNGGTITIETANIDFNEPYAIPHSEIKPGPYILFALSDTGIGMDKEIQTHIFEPFFTTKEPGKGTGLGLSTVYGIVIQSGGNIVVISEPGQGTTFKIYFHRIAAAVPRERKKVLPHTFQGTETVLVVEDEEPVRRLVCRVLKRYGYKIIPASNGIEALDIFRGRMDEIDLLLTDTIMPEMNGPELAKQAKSLLPRIKIIFMSGYIDTVISHTAAEVNFIQKPFDPEGLAQKVREVLGTAIASSKVNQKL